MRRAAVLTMLGVVYLWAADTKPADTEFFETSVRPVLVKNCLACHGPAQQASSLRVDSRESLLKGGNRGAAVIPGDAALSPLLRAVRHDGLKMPVGGKLKPEEIAALEKWVTAGAPWPAGTVAAKGPGSPGYYEGIKKEHWAFQPVRRAELPAGDPAWSSHPVDRYLAAAMAKAQLKPTPGADRATLLRRLSLVLTGLPPTPLEVDLFVRDAAPGAYERQVDRLLKSPHFGEHWARHWLDLMRFAETFGNDWNYEINGAWHYRDYLIRAFNSDVPYDQLVREHLAGDLLEKPRVNAKSGINESLIGTTSYRLGELGHDDCIRFRQIRTDVVDNQIDTVGKAFLGLTIACARCHDHKLDPIPTADYYALYGVLSSSRMVMRTADVPQAQDRIKQQLAALKAPIRREVAKVWRLELETMPRYLMAAYRAWSGGAPVAADVAELPVERVQAWVSQFEKPKAGMEEPLSVLARVGKGDLATEWAAAAKAYAQESASRTAYNRENFQPFGDLAKDGFGGWQADGTGLTGALAGASRAGEFAVANRGTTAISGIFPAGIYTHALSERLNGGLRSPLVPKDKKFVSLEVMGGELGARRTILDNCMLSEDYQLIENARPAWVKVPNRDDQKALPFYVELVTKQDNPRIPDRPGRLKTTPEQVASPYSYFGVARAVLHDVDASPKPELSHVERLFAGPAPKQLEDVAARYAQVTRQALAAWEAGTATDDDARWLGWLLDAKLLSNNTEMTPELSTLVSEYRAIDARIAAPTAVQALADMEPGYDVSVMVGGDAERPGRLAPRGFLSLLSKPGATFNPMGSGRREIADLIADPANPLTSRVMANRIWQQVFGRGIVATADNFGTYGEKPTHPELLDYLATQFVDGGWSVKKQIRLLVTSKAFQQAGTANAEAVRTDPRNALLSHFPIRRMEAESIRDSILAISGRLDRTMYGPSIQPHREEPKDYRKLHQGPLDGDGRRSIYVKVTRHEGSRFLETFDFPNPNVARGTRDTTNVPPQALALMNDPFVVAQAGVWAEQLIAQQAPTVEARIAAMFRTALGRAPEAAETERFVGLTKELASLQKVPADKLMGSRELWKDVAHAVFNLKEFVYLR
ncbi:MAG: PSD1 and planctomycete cytochrome C domain-containing protein [Acidobacteria bacterium]|nr:PSD1 and planctomycete cytochrome C domain-containing protein [Acidobacteriota bacterium]